MNKQLTQHFKVSEMASPDVPATGYLMDKTFMQKLEYARQLAGIPFIINSGYRTIKYNKFVKGSKNSSHLKGLAADIHIQNSRTRFIILKALLDANFTRIGVYKTFIHVDLDTSKHQRVIWYQ